MTVEVHICKPIVTTEETLHESLQQVFRALPFDSDGRFTLGLLMVVLEHQDFIVKAIKAYNEHIDVCALFSFEQEKR